MWTHSHFWRQSPIRPLRRGRMPFLLVLFCACSPPDQRRKMEIVERPKAERSAKTAPGDSSRKPQTDSNKPRTPGQTLELKVLDPGREPRRELAYGFQRPASATYTVRIRQVSEAPEPIGSYEASYAMRLSLDVRPEAPPQPSRNRKPGARDAKAPPGTWYEYVLQNLQFDLPQRLDVDPELAKEKLQGTRFSFLLDPSGRILRQKDTLERAAAGKRRANHFLTIHPRLPASPVGPGARWQVETVFRTAPGIFFGTKIETRLTATYTLSAWARTRFGTAAKLDVATEIRAESTTAHFPVRAQGQGKASLLLLANGLIVSYRGNVQMAATARDTSSRSRTTYRIQLETLRFAPPGSRAPRPGHPATE